jgi:outer membrane protein insertion porin family
MKVLKAVNVLVLFCSLLFVSCGVKNFPKETPFVYDNKIEILNRELKKEEKSVLKDKLTTQLADSLQLKIKERFIFFEQLIDPARFDTSYVSQSAANMDIYLKTIGYYNGKTNYSYSIDTVENGETQYRATTNFRVNTGPVFRLDSIAFLLYDSSRAGLTQPLQKLTDLHRHQSFLKKDIPFTEELMLNELERLVELYRNNGYYNFSREQLYVDVDTVYLPLLNPLLDPFERIEVLQEAQRRREYPKINVFIRTIPKADTATFQVYRVGKITVFPDYTNATADTSTYQSKESGNITVRYKNELFKPSFLHSHIPLKPGNIYRLRDLNQTLDELNSLGTWQFIKVEPKLAPLYAPADTPAIDFDFILVPSKKYSFSADLESVFNQTQQSASATAGNLIGLGLNLGLRNRNFDRQAIQFSNTIRGGIESGIGGINRGLQATELTYNNSFTMPRLLFLGPKWDERFRFKRTFINTNISAINRNVSNKGLFSLTTIGSSLGWQVRNKKNEIITVRPLNVEYVNLFNVSPGFQAQLDTTPFLRFSFTEGLVIGSSFSFSKPLIKHKKSNRNSYLRLGIEESGALFGRLKRLSPIFDKELFEYVKAEVEFKHEIKNPTGKTSWVFRTMAGAGFLYDDTTSMPFFKQFAGGGPNSMRAWPLRSIGPGRSPLDTRRGRSQFFSRSGDIIFEANAEYRYNIATILPNTFVIRGALFTDIGNVWNFQNKSNRNNDTVVLRMKNFYRDLGVSVGSGFRFDFVGLFLLRVDFGFRVKNPALPFSQTNNGWRIPDINFANIFGSKEANRQWRYENFNFSLGINYPF